MIFDMHVHTKYSCDSKVEIEDYCQKAIQKQIHILAFTDHVDYNKADFGYGFYRSDTFFNDLNMMKNKYNSKIQLLAGIEFSEPHLYQNELKEFHKLPYDIILGCVHYWYKDMFPSQMLKENISAEICYEYYWDEIHKAVKTGGFDCLGHMDFPKRYYKKLLFDENKIREICLDLIKSNICLEINTSSLRKGLSETIPDKDILEIYHSCGGRDVTIGSDAHTVDDLAADFSHARALISYYGFQEVVFSNRQKKAVDTK